MTAAKKPPHRPSRRSAVVASAMELFSAPGSDTVTVAEIARDAGMTSAAVYYHFASKDEILLEGLRAVGEQLVAETKRLAAEVADSGSSIDRLPVGLLHWIDGHRIDSTVWFVSSAGVSLAVEQLRREQRGQLMQLLSRAVRHARPGLPAPETAVVATALMSLVEVSASTWLSGDDTLTHLGPEGFLTEVGMLALRITGTS